MKLALRLSLAKLKPVCGQATGAVVEQCGAAV